MDIIVIGSGPAGYTAGIYAVRAGLTVLILTGSEAGGQLMTTTEVENFPGFPEGINGPDLMEKMRSQCEKLGCILKAENATSIEIGSVHTVKTAENTYIARAIIIATGATAKKLDIPHGELLWNNGISACAVCDGALPFFRDQPLFVVGGGDTACEEAIYLSRFGSHVYMLVRGDKMRASHRMRNKVETNEKITIYYHTYVVDAIPSEDKYDPYLVGLRINRNGVEEVMDAGGLFYAIGHIPNTSFLPQVLEKDATGYLITDNTKTNIPGIFACGDVQDKVYRQAITAAGSGCMAALEAERYLA